MNRLIIIGNGFDLAHGMKTSYNDFIINYFKKALNQADTTKSYEDDLISIKISTANHSMFHFCNILANTDDLVDFCYKKDLLFDFFSGGVIQINNVDHFYNPFTCIIKSDFFSNLVRKCSHASWVAIENEYYAFLVTLLKYDEEIRLDAVRD